MSRSRNLKGCLNERGQSAVEFAFIIPLLFVFFFAVLEFSQLFIQKQRVSALSREVANAAFRDCSTLTGADLEACLEDVVQQVANGAASMLDDFSTRGAVIASVFIPDPASQLVPAEILRSGIEKAGSSDYDSLFSSDTLDRQFVSDQGVITVGEVFYEYRTVTPIRKILELLNLPSTLYEITVF